MIASVSAIGKAVGLTRTCLTGNSFAKRMKFLNKGSPREASDAKFDRKLGCARFGGFRRRRQSRPIRQGDLVM